MANTIAQTNRSNPVEFVKEVLRGTGQVMFQNSAWTGLLFMIGIFWGAYQEGLGLVAWGSVVGVVVSTLTGYLIGFPRTDGAQGLWGFNGVLVGCAFPTFLGNTVWMWLALILCSALTTWVRTGFNNIMAPWKVNSFTFPFVFCTWLFLLAARAMHGMPDAHLATPELPAAFSSFENIRFGHLVVYWLKGIAQVFLINSWVTGIFFLVGLFLSNRWAALWAAIGSAVALFIALIFKASGSDIVNGLYGFSPVLTAIALATVFYKPNWKSAIWALLGIAVTVFIQAGMDVMMTPLGIPTLTGPFCVATWLFLLPLLKFDDVQRPDHHNWDADNKTHLTRRAPDAPVTDPHPADAAPAGRPGTPCCDDARTANQAPRPEPAVRPRTDSDSMQRPQSEPRPATKGNAGPQPDVRPRETENEPSARPARPYDESSQRREAGDDRPQRGNGDNGDER